jgi:hypothetical protein
MEAQKSFITIILPKQGDIARRGDTPAQSRKQIEVDMVAKDRKILR